MLTVKHKSHLLLSLEKRCNLKTQLEKLNQVKFIFSKKCFQKQGPVCQRKETKVKRTECSGLPSLHLINFPTSNKEQLTELFSGRHLEPSPTKWMRQTQISPYPSSTQCPLCAILLLRRLRLDYRRHSKQARWECLRKQYSNTLAHIYIHINNKQVYQFIEMRGYSLLGFRRGIWSFRDKRSGGGGAHAGGPQRGPNTFSIFSLGILDRNQWADAAERFSGSSGPT